MTKLPDIARTTPQHVRELFPAFHSDTGDVLLDNAGGAQLPGSVIDSMTEYLRTRYVQLGADYATSRRAVETVQGAHRVAECLMNADRPGSVAFGSSTTALITMLASAIAEARPAQPDRDEIIVCDLSHESNIGPLTKLCGRGFHIKHWSLDPETHTCDLQQLSGLLNERTRIVALTHVSNILGRIEPLKQAINMAHEAGAKVVIDGVAYAPHRAIDVQALDADWYAYSAYKVFGPHMAALYGKAEAFAELPGQNHFFVPSNNVPYAFEPGGCSHEACAGLLGLVPYLNTLAGVGTSELLHRQTVEAAYEVIESLETPLQNRLLEYLRARNDVRIIGPAHSTDRVATVSFVHERVPSRAIALAANERGLGIRYGHFYAHRLCTSIGLAPDDGVVRTSFTHYNTLEEVDRLIECFEETFN